MLEDHGFATNERVRQRLPTGQGDLERFLEMVRQRHPFTFVRFSDGETEILKNRKLVISGGVTEFRGRVSTNKFPEFDRKHFDPSSGQVVRADLLAAACFRDRAFYKGIPTRHNRAVDDREFMLRLNGGFTEQMTFSDLFLNANFLEARRSFFPALIEAFQTVCVVGNHRCSLQGKLAQGQLIPIPDNFFSCYEDTRESVLAALSDVAEGALVLSSASSLSNVVGHQLRIDRPDITFLDIGTVLNDMIGLPLGTRAYHSVINPVTFKDKLVSWRYRWHREYQLRW